jgi:hypothetical protein
MIPVTHPFRKVREKDGAPGKRVSIAVLILWVIRNIIVVTSEFQWPYLGTSWVGAVIGYNFFDLRVWMLLLGIVLLQYREKKTEK